MSDVLVIQLSGEGVREIRRILAATTDDAGALAASLPAGSGLWRVPSSGEATVRRDLAGIPGVARGIRLADRIARRTEPPELLWPWLARVLFDDWNPTADPELLAAQWHGLSADDRRFWTDRAQAYLDLLTGKDPVC